MTEEQFWRSNPRIIKVWESAWKEEQIYNNKLAHSMVGNYFMSAMMVAISQVMQPMLCDGKKSQAKYIQEPMQLFPLTEEEKKQKQEAAIAQFMAWANSQEKRHRKEE